MDKKFYEVPTVCLFNFESRDIMAESTGGFYGEDDDLTVKLPKDTI